MAPLSNDSTVTATPRVSSPLVTAHVTDAPTVASRSPGQATESGGESDWAPSWELIHCCRSAALTDAEATPAPALSASRDPAARARVFFIPLNLDRGRTVAAEASPTWHKVRNL